MLNLGFTKRFVDNIWRSFNEILPPHIITLIQATTAGSPLVGSLIKCYKFDSVSKGPIEFQRVPGSQRLLRFQVSKGSRVLEIPGFQRFLGSKIPEFQRFQVYGSQVPEVHRVQEFPEFYAKAPEIQIPIIPQFLGSRGFRVPGIFEVPARVPEVPEFQVEPRNDAFYCTW